MKFFAIDRRSLLLTPLLISILLAAGEAAAAQVRLVWKDNSGNEDGFKIERQNGSGAFVQLAVAAADTTSYTDAAVAAGSVYCYRLRAYNSIGNSAYTNTACATPSASPPPSSSPPTPRPPTSSPKPPAPSDSDSRPSFVGVFRPGTGAWRLDLDGNGRWGTCAVDDCMNGIGGTGDLPVVGSWGASSKDQIGFFDSQTGYWYLDRNGNDVIDGCEATTCRYLFGKPGDRPVAGDWTGSGKTRIGVFRPSTGKWYLDLNGNGVMDGCSVDRCVPFGRGGDLPVTGDWTGSGVTELGIFRPGTRQWFLATSAPQKLHDCDQSPCVYTFGAKGDLPVVGDWDGDGRDQIGVFRPSTGAWRLDADGDGRWDNCEIDDCPGPFGLPGDLPIAGKW